MVGMTASARPPRPSGPGETTPWRPRWTRLLDEEAPDHVDVPVPTRWETPAPSARRGLGSQEKVLAGTVASIAAMVIVAALLWHITGLVLDAAFPAHVAPAKAPVATPTTARSAAPTATRAVVTITIVPTAAAAPTSATELAAAPTAVAPSPTVAPTTAPPTAAPPTTVPPTVTPAPMRTAPDERVHTVERGDTLYSIARRNGTTVNALAAANGLPSPDAVLSVGRRLVIP